MATDDLLATTHFGTLLRVRDLASEEELLVLPVDFGGVNTGTLALTPDGRYLFYTRGDGVLVRVFLDQQELIDVARQRVQRGFTAEECERYFPAGDCPTA